MKSGYLLTIDEYYFNSSTRRFDCGYGNDLSEFDVDCLRRVERLKIGGDCFKNVNRFVLDGLNELKSMKIGKNSFDHINSRKGSECVIMNCDQLCDIHFDKDSFHWYESFELKNLPSLISIHIESCTLSDCQRVVFDSMND